MGTTVAGYVKWESCWRQAAYLSKYIYKDPPGADGFKTEFPEKMAEVEKNWEMWDEQNEQSRSGLVTRLFKLKKWDPADPKAPPCPPCLVFRGTDFEDMRDLAIASSIRVRWGVIWWTFNFLTIMDATMPKKMSRPARGSGSHPIDYTREDLVKLGFTAIPILNEVGTSSIESAADGEDMTLNLTITAEIMAKKDGDWLSNILQGLGRGSPQYDQAIKFGRKVTKDKIIKLNDKRLEITGHSLGGGLAAAVCCVLDHEYPDITFHGMTFNAAGVHPKTIAPAALSDGVINNFTVEDEMLTTVQSYTSQLPIVGAVLKIAARTLGMAAMPPALGTMRRVHGVSPGGSLGKKGSSLANLFPVQSQTLVPSAPKGFPVLTAIDGLLAGSTTATQFGTAFAKWLNTTYRQRALSNLSNNWFQPIWQIYQEMGRLLLEDADPEIKALTDIMKAAAEYHGMDVVIATYDSII